MLNPEDLYSIFLTLKLALISTLILLLIGIPTSWWLSQSNHPIKNILNSILSLPLVLPPTVLGFYLLYFMGPNGFIGEFTSYLGIETLPFSFMGLVFGSVIYSMPFVIQPLKNTFESISRGQIEASLTLGANPIQTFFSVILPQSKSGILVATILGFAHTVGEFGVVLMLGGNITGKTKVLSVNIYEKVEMLDYKSAHELSLILLIFSFIVLFLIQKYSKNKQNVGVF